MTGWQHPCSVLIVPGDRADLMAKTTRIRPDAVILDLEDGVAPAARNVARVTSAEWALSTATERSGLTELFTRVNSVGSPEFMDDIASAVASGTGVVVPKVESAKDVHAVLEAIGVRTPDERRVIVGIETARGVEHAFEIAGAGVSGLYFGAEDFVADVEGVRTRAGAEVAYARARTVVAARAAGIAPFDLVVVDVRDDEAFVESCGEAGAFGFAGKLCIHPRQVVLLHEAFDPTPAEVAAAREIIARHVEAVESGSGICVVDGRMIDAPLVAQAHQVESRARRAGARRGD